MTPVTRSLIQTLQADSDPHPSTCLVPKPPLAARCPVVILAKEHRVDSIAPKNAYSGLVKGGPLDTSRCARSRGSCYRIDLPNFLDLIRQQLSKDLDTECKPVGIPGACGVLLWADLLTTNLRLSS
ncbi:hypothetical protein K469DRAFT_695463 [Zopfia rhizophila CBS 207.26]|uniref:Uncharacterized protein n=1 Tax=Zopfia rhizophila CBS 207.26 TaxID=1314779 RepID=A0A6A6DGX3_9PEZI|nr:hypothetical protein K469DRAFT_695463 [Zopfia rhizophila CBS 207.26]